MHNGGTKFARSGDLPPVRRQLAVVDPTGDKLVLRETDATTHRLIDGLAGDAHMHSPAMEGLTG